MRLILFNTPLWSKDQRCISRVQPMVDRNHRSLGSPEHPTANCSHVSRLSSCPLHRTVVVEPKEMMMIWHVNVIALDMPSRTSRVQDDLSFLFFIIPLRNRDHDAKIWDGKEQAYVCVCFPISDSFSRSYSNKLCMCFHFFHLTVEHWLERANRKNHNTDRLCQQVQSNIAF